MDHRAGKTLFITGGHVTPAVALIEEIRSRNLPWDIVFVGRQKAMESDVTDSEEFRLIRSMSIPFLPLSTGRFRRDFGTAAFLSLLKVPAGFIQALGYCRSVRPSLIVSFGGYIALPVVAAGWLLGIPSITHEQTRVPGLANRLISLFARRICVSFPEVAAAFPSEKTVYTGLPIRRTMLGTVGRFSQALPGQLPILFVTGGSTGARSLNELLYPIVPHLVRRFAVVHQTGEHSLAAALEVKKKLPERERSRYVPGAYFSGEDMSWLLHRAKIIIGRSGANTVAEISALGKIAIFIPLPWAGKNEQAANAAALVSAGSAILIEQKGATPERLQEAVNTALAHFEVLQARAQETAKRFPRDGAEKLLGEIIALLT